VLSFSYTGIGSRSNRAGSSLPAVLEQGEKEGEKEKRGGWEIAGSRFHLHEGCGCALSSHGKKRGRKEGDQRRRSPRLAYFRLREDRATLRTSVCVSGKKKERKKDAHNGAQIFASGGI